MALPKKYRLPGYIKKSFRKTYKQSLRAYALKRIIFNVLVRDNSAGKRFRFVVDNKISKNAVVRNKIRRRLREGIREFIPNIKNGDYIFYIKPEILDKDLNFIRSEFEKTFNITDN